MFELKCFVDDKKLAQAMHVLDGLVYDLRVVPVKHAVGSANGVQSTALEGRTQDLLLSVLKQKKIKQFTTKEAVSIVKGLKRAPKSTGAVLTQLMKEKALRRKGSARYEVVQ